MRNYRNTIFLLVLSSFYSDHLLAQQINPSLNQKQYLAMDSDDKVHFWALGGTDNLKFDKLSALSGLNLSLSPIRPILFNLNFNYGGKLSEAEPGDSIQLSPFYFPDITQTAFNGSFEADIPHVFSKPLRTDREKRRAYLKNEYPLLMNNEKQLRTNRLIFCFEGAFQNKKLILNSDSMITEEKLIFGTFSMGLKYKWMYNGGKDDRQGVLTIGVFRTEVYINQESRSNLNQLLQVAEKSQFNPNQNPLKGYSFLVSFQYDDFIVYFRSYTDEILKKDLIVSVGIKALGHVFSH